MRLIVFFDLPTTSKEDKRAYVLFRRFLLKDGYDMLQWSVYSRIANGEDNIQKHQQRLVMNLPKKGAVRCMKVSEKQYAGMQILLGKATTQEDKIGAKQLVLF